MDNELWLPLHGASEYEVSDHGRVRRVVAKERCPAKILKPNFAGRERNYRYIGITYDDGQRRVGGVHALVLRTFRGDKPSLRHECAHLDGNPDNNRLDNLQWKLPVENAADRIRHGTQTRGIRYGLHKLDEDKVREIRAAPGSQREVGKRFGVSQSMVHRIRSGLAWRHV